MLEVESGRAVRYCTYVQESQLAFIIGNKPLSEFDDFVQNIYDMGIEHCIEVRQAAYAIQHLERVP